MKKAAALTLLLILLAALPAIGWTVEDCVEVDYDHPHCDQYTTTTTYQTTTTEPEVTTTTPNETTTTVEQQETTTTTAAPCPEGFLHQPPLCVNPSTTVPQVEVSSTVVSAPVVLEELPLTGDWTALLGSISGLFLLAGLGLVSRSRKDV